MNADRFGGARAVGRRGVDDKSATADLKAFNAFALNGVAHAGLRRLRGEDFEQAHHAFDGASERNGAKRRRRRGVAPERDMNMRVACRSTARSLMSAANHRDAMPRRHRPRPTPLPQS